MKIRLPLVFTLATALTLWARATPSLSAANNEWKAKNRLAEKLRRLSSSPFMQEASNPDSAGGKGQSFNRNDGNSFSSDTTYHSYVWDYCMKWIGNRVCEKWLDPYVALHGMSGERSPLEEVVAMAWTANEKNVGKDVYKIWRVAANGPLTDVDGKLNRKSLKLWELTPEVRSRVEQEGTKTANKQLRLTYDENAEERQGNTMPNPESLRTVAGRWTKMFRNRLVASLGEIRASQQPIEFMLGEDKYDCDQYMVELKRDPDPMGLEERIRTQPLLDPVTRAEQLERRYNLCMKMQRQSVYSVNPIAQGDDIRSGGKESEQFDAWRIRANIAAIDYAGIDPNSVQKPSNAALTREEVSSEIADYEVGGQEYAMVRQTNSEQIAGYNQALAESAARKKALTNLSGNIKDNSKDITRWQIKNGALSAIELNGLTPEMKSELAGTNFPKASNKKASPEQQVERTPSQLVIKAARK